MNRRHFLGSSTAALSSLTIRASAPEGSNQVTVGIMGMGTRGKALARALAPMEGIRIAWIVEPDKNRLAESLDLLGKAQPKGKSLPSADENYQRILDDKSVDALIVTAPNHWHAPATILGCAAGKHVYVEKPCCHNPQEGLWMIEAAKKHGRLVQTGTQRRSWTGIQEAMQRLREGEIGELHAAQIWYYASRGSIGKGMEAATPEGLNYPAVGGTRASQTFPHQLPPLQLALVLALGKRGTGEQRYPLARPGPVGDGRHPPRIEPFNGRQILFQR